MPVNTLILISIISFLLSLIYIGSLTAYGAIISLGTLGLLVSYVIPILFILLRRINGPPIEYGPFSVGRWGIPINLFSLVYLLYVIIWTPFPQILPVNAQSMNYAAPVFIAVILGALADWAFSGHKRFEIPVPQHTPRFKV